MYKRYCFIIYPLGQGVRHKVRKIASQEVKPSGLDISVQHESLEEVLISTAIKSPGFRKLDLSASMKVAL